MELKSTKIQSFGALLAPGSLPQIQLSSVIKELLASLRLDGFEVRLARRAHFSMLHARRILAGLSGWESVMAVREKCDEKSGSHWCGCADVSTPNRGF